jgi:hypothetical protein
LPDIAAELDAMLKSPDTVALAKSLLTKYAKIAKTKDVNTAMEWAALMKQSNWDLKAFWHAYHQALDKAHPEIKQHAELNSTMRTNSWASFISIPQEDLEKQEKEPRLK